jgi:hypothetical protein
MFTGILGGKKWHESLTVWGLIVAGVVNGLEGGGALPAGSSEAIVNLGNSLAGLLVVLGIRKAAVAPNVSAP